MGAFQLTWPEAMGVVVIEGLVILLLVVTRFRQAVMDSVPLALKQSIAVGIGLFLTIIGFIDAGFVTSTKLPNPPLQLGAGELKGAAVFVFVFGLLLAIYLFVRRVRAALLVSILVTTVVAVIVNELVLGGRGFQGKAKVGAVVDVPSASSFELVGNFSFGFFAQLGLLAAVLAVFTLMLSDFFDTMGTAFGLGRQAGLVDASGRVHNQERILYVDSAAAAVGGALSASSVTTYIESAAGIGEGARTGLASLVTGVLFLVAVLVSPLARIIPFEAAAPALVVVGFLLMSTVREIAWDDFELAIPAFLTIVVMPFTYSITNGIGAGFVTYVFLKVVRGKAREVPITMYVAAVAFAIYFGIAYVRALLT